MSDSVINDILKKIADIFEATDMVMQEWNGEGNLQFPTLLNMLSSKMGWDEKQVREADPIIRFYIRRNPDYYVTRGAHGGIMRASDKSKKEALKFAKNSIKKQMQEELERKVAQITANSNNININSLTSSGDDDLENIFSDAEDSE